jgi:uncharacterized protein
MNGPLRFDVAEIRARGRLELEETVPADVFQPLLENEPLLSGPVLAALSLTARGGEIEAVGSVSGSWELECWRCGEKARSDYRASVEAAVEAGEKGTLDLADEVRQTLVLAVPMRPVCKTDCRGFCPKCRTNLNLKSCSCKENSNA